MGRQSRLSGPRAVLLGKIPGAESLLLNYSEPSGGDYLETPGSPSQGSPEPDLHVWILLFKVLPPKRISNGT